MKAVEAAVCGIPSLVFIIKSGLKIKKASCIWKKQQIPRSMHTVWSLAFDAVDGWLHLTGLCQNISPCRQGHAGIAVVGFRYFWILRRSRFKEAVVKASERRGMTSSWVPSSGYTTPGDKINVTKAALHSTEKDVLFSLNRKLDTAKTITAKNNTRKSSESVTWTTLQDNLQIYSLNPHINCLHHGCERKKKLLEGLTANLWFSHKISRMLSTDWTQLQVGIFFVCLAEAYLPGVLAPHQGFISRFLPHGGKGGPPCVDLNAKRSGCDLYSGSVAGITPKKIATRSGN
ncbi:hypothetical protein CAPTEDRAFT_214004 [Capitella teleta]|uniref:Uncharacterized protein n=1 Tax=Capitella teleta TaxID=283909 RepID=R7TKE5_CAPTE|nr:hypothetical protein CAPTEDRAFT_214004 [Capitella teleta]|eukprot:ELT94278.1 hypothetical protein CAPTEDRAFT_214004 [Capitella teleta]